MDPFDNTCGYELPRLAADIWTSSHNHYDHNYRKAILNESVLDGANGLSIEGASIKTVHTYHDKVQGAKWGDNLIIKVEMDGLRIAHLGDLGHELNQNHIVELGLVDILLIPTGGIFTIDEAEAARVAKAINAHLTIPMHYHTDHLQGFELQQGLEIFLKNLGWPLQYNPSNTIEVTKDSLPDCKVVVLELA